MRIKYFVTAFATLLAMSNIFSQSFFSRVIEQADIVPKTYGEICEDYYTSYDKLLEASVDTRRDGTPNIVVKEDDQKIIITIRLSINEAQYSAWKTRTSQKIDALKLSNSVSSFEDPEARSIAGRGYRFGDNEETAISQWERKNSSVMKVRDYAILVEYINHQGKVIESKGIPISYFERKGFNSYPLPLHHLNRLKELPFNVEWGVDEDSYYSFTRENTTIEWMNSISNIRCRVLSLNEVNAFRAEQKRIAREKAESLIKDMVRIPDSSEHKGLYFGKYEVTQAQWQAIMGNNPSCYKGDLSRPVEEVSRNECQEFIKKLNARAEVKQAGLTFFLPTEEQWEYACRAGSTGGYGLLADGREGTLDEMGWYSDNSGKQTHPVGQKKPNAWGLYDMHGNVKERTASGGYYSICRGGSFYSDAENCEADYRDDIYHGSRLNFLGFRLAALNKVEAERIAREKAEAERKAREEAKRKAREEAERNARERAESLIKDMVRIPDSAEHKGLYFGKYEVTQAQWQAIMGDNPSDFEGDLSRPVEQVSWNDCQDFIKKLNAHAEVKQAGLIFFLPTEEQWEYACRAGSTGKYGLLADGREGTLDEMGWYRDNLGFTRSKTHPVGQKKPNAWGLYDMHGNVKEWTASGDNDDRIYCGGSWRSCARHCEADSGRSYAGYCGAGCGGRSCLLGSRDCSLGFRLAASRTEK